MFSLRIHSIEDRLRPEGSQHPRIHESRGIVHLYRRVSHHPEPLPAGRTTLLFVLAVPSRVTIEDFLFFCGPHLDHVTDIDIVRTDAVDDRYSILIKLDNQKGADSFYRNFNGRRFFSSEAEICHILFTDKVEYTELNEIASTPPTAHTELPTCPVCLERLDQDTSGILTALCDHSFQCSCVSKWTDSSCRVCRFCLQQPEKPTCSVCETSEKLWICVICGIVGCGRYKEGHAIRHWKDTQHCYSLDLETQRVWDYVGDNYVHRLNQSKSDGKLRCKVNMPKDSPTSSTNKSEKVPSCPCGQGKMRLFMLRTTKNPGRYLWECPKTKHVHGCGRFIWDDEVDDKALIDKDFIGQDSTSLAALKEAISEIQTSQIEMAEAISEVRALQTEMGNEVKQMAEAISEVRASQTEMGNEVKQMVEAISKVRASQTEMTTELK